eukprot:NODE_303_length_10328_cov_1.228077.p1 type:complete len:835 gc:universal NODE_303_length_10328_cov_1.228077:5601-3097(-)
MLGSLCAENWIYRKAFFDSITFIGDCETNFQMSKSTLKKNMQFSKKLKVVNSANKDALISELRSLKVENYKAEIISSLAENFSHQNSMEDIEACSSIFCAVKEKFQGEFYLEIAELLKKTLLSDCKDKIIKTRNVIFLATTLHQKNFFIFQMNNNIDAFDSIMGGGVLPTQSKKAKQFDPEKFVKDIYRYITEKDDDFSNAATVVEFLNNFKTLNDGYEPLNMAYLNRLKDYMKKLNKALIKAEKYERDYLFDRGHEVPEENRKKRLLMNEKFDNLLNSLDTLCSKFQQEMPKFEKLAAEMVRQGSITFSQNLDAMDSSLEVWDEVDDPNFYKIIEDLRNHVPRLFEPTVQSGEVAEELSPEGEDQEENILSETEDAGEIVEEQSEAKKEAILEHTSRTPLSEHLDNLIEVTNQEKADLYAIEFCQFNSKTSRKKLVLKCIKTGKRRQELIPLFCRVIKTLGKYFSDIINTMKTIVDQNFRSLIRKNSESKSMSYVLEPRYCIVTFISELLKFQIIDPPLYIFYFQTLLEYLNYKPNIYTVCKLLDTGGRFFYAITKLDGNSVLRAKFEEILQTMIKKKAILDKTDERYALEIENSYFNVISTHEVKVTNLWDQNYHEAFISEYLMELNDENRNTILSYILKLPWDDRTEIFLLKILSNPIHSSYSSTHHLAYLLSKILPYYPLFILQVIDKIAETIKFDFISNLFRFNQRRISLMKYAGELFNHGLVNMEFILDVLQFTLSFGWDKGFPFPNEINLYDAPHDYFRIRLFCTLLQTSGSHLQQYAKNEMKIVIGMFYVYLNSKKLTCPVPLEITHFIVDSFKVYYSYLEKRIRL